MSALAVVSTLVGDIMGTCCPVGDISPSSGGISSIGGECLSKDRPLWLIMSGDSNLGISHVRDREGI